MLLFTKDKKKNERTPWHILYLKHSSGKFRHLKDKLMTIQNYDML
jgi:ribosomal protein L19E